jgi:signal transduction histidine kinase
MKKIIISVLAIFFTIHLSAQNKEDKIIDSLKLAFSKEKTDTGKVNILVETSRMYSHGSMYKNNDSSWKYLNLAMNLSKRIGYARGERHASFDMAEYFFETGNYPEALKIALQNLNDIQQSGDIHELFYEARQLNWIYNSIGNGTKALEYAKKLNEIADSPELHDSATIRLYKQMAYLNLGGTYFDLNQQDSGLYYLSLLYKNALKDNDTQFRALVTHQMGDYYSRKRKDSLAFHFFMECIFYAKKSSRIDLMADSKFGMAYLFYEQKHPDSSFLYVRQALQDIEKVDEPDVNAHSYHLLSDLYKDRHQYDSAFKYLTLYTVLQDSLNNQNKITQAQNLSFNETLHEQQLEQAQKEAQQQYATKIKFYILAAVILVFLIIAVLLFRNVRNKKKANILLNYQKKEIESTLSELKSTQAQLIQSEKMASLGELTAGIAHEIQNPLNFVNNFSDVNQELVDELQTELKSGNIEEAIAISNDIKENEEKINHHGKRADAIVKGMLQHSGKSSGQKELTDINALADEYLRLSYHGLRAKDKSFNATIETDFDPSIGKINIIPQDIGRVFLNLFNNAFYAVNEQKSSNPVSYNPTVSVRTEKCEDKIYITVADNGNGIPQKILDKIFQPFFTTKPTGQGTGLGLSLSYDIIKAHGGEIKLESKEGEGSEFVIQL